METASAAARCTSESSLLCVCSLYYLALTLPGFFFVRFHVNFPELLGLGASRGFPALLSRTQPKLAPSGRVSSQLVLKRCPVTKKTTFPFYVQLLGGGISFLWTISWICVAWPHLTPFFFFCLCMICLPACTARPPVRPSVPSHRPAQGNEHWRTWVLSRYPNCLFYWSLISCWEEFGCSPRCISYLVASGLIKPGTCNLF